MSSNVKVIENASLAHLLTLLRDKNTSPRDFRLYTKTIGQFLAYEATADLATEQVTVTTPLEDASCPKIKNNLVVLSIMRAGNGLLESALDVLPYATGGHIGLERVDHGRETKEYYFKAPGINKDSDVLIVDPMVATGGSVKTTLDKVISLSPNSVRFACLLMSPQAKEMLETHYPKVKVYTAAIDREMNETNYILPGLGDAGDRYYATEE